MHINKINGTRYKQTDQVAIQCSNRKIECMEEIKKYVKAFEMAQDEVTNSGLEDIKREFKQVLSLIEQKKQQKEQIEEEIRVLKLDLEDMKAGKFDKIKQRQDNSSMAKRVSPVTMSYNPQALEDWWKQTWNITWTNGNDVQRKTFFF